MKFSVLILALILCQGADAQTYRCVKDNKTIYSDQPCNTETARKLVEEKSAEPVQVKPVFNEYKIVIESPTVQSPIVPLPSKPIARAPDNERPWGLILLIAGLYFLPAIIAGSRKHHNETAIILLNILLGWTVIGWLASLIWSATAIKRVDKNNKIAG